MVHSRVDVHMLPVFHTHDLSGLDGALGDVLKYFESGTGRLYGDVLADLMILVITRRLTSNS